MSNSPGISKRTFSSPSSHIESKEEIVQVCAFSCSRFVIFNRYSPVERKSITMLAMSTLMMPAPTMACAQPIAVGPHKPPEAKLLAIHPAHNQTTPQHQIHVQQQSQQIPHALTSSNKPGTPCFTHTNWIWPHQGQCKNWCLRFFLFLVRRTTYYDVWEEYASWTFTKNNIIIILFYADVFFF